MLARWIPRHFRRMLRLLPGQFPGNPAEGDSNWQRLVRTIAGVTVGDPIVGISPVGFVLAGDQTVRYPSGMTQWWVEVGESSRVARAYDGINDGSYQCVGATFDGTNTTVRVDEPIPSIDAGISPAELGYLRPSDASTLAVARGGLQEIEEVLLDLRNQLRLSTATGRALEVIGEILGLPRTLSSDAGYRQDLRVQAAILHSRGRIEEIISAAQGLSGIAVVRLLEHPLARIFLHIFGLTLGPGTRARLRSTKAGGVAMDIIGTEGTPFVFGFDMDAAGVGAVPPGEDPDGEGFGEAYPIIAVLVGGPGAGAFYVANDATAALNVGDPCAVFGSAGNDGNYTITGVTFEPGPVRTRIDVAEAVGAAGPLPDGILSDGGDGSGEFCEVW